MQRRLATFPEWGQSRRSAVSDPAKSQNWSVDNLFSTRLQIAGRRDGPSVRASLMLTSYAGRLCPPVPRTACPFSPFSPWCTHEFGAASRCQTWFSVSVGRTLLSDWDTGAASGWRLRSFSLGFWFSSGELLLSDQRSIGPEGTALVGSGQRDRHRTSESAPETERTNRKAPRERLGARNRRWRLSWPLVSDMSMPFLSPLPSTAALYRLPFGLNFLR